MIPVSDHAPARTHSPDAPHGTTTGTGVSTDPTTPPLSETPSLSELAYDFLARVGNPDTRAYSSTLPALLDDLLHGMPSPGQRQYMLATLAERVTSTRHDTPLFWTHLFSHLEHMSHDLPAPAPSHPDARPEQHPFDRVTQAYARSPTQRPDGWRAMVACLRDSAGADPTRGSSSDATHSAGMLAVTLARTDVTDSTTWTALVNCAALLHLHRTGSEHEARMVLARHLADQGVTDEAAWTAIFKAATPMSPAQRDEMLGVFYAAGPGVTSLRAVAAELPTSSTLLLHALHAAPSLKPGVLTALVQHAMASRQMLDLALALAALDDDGRAPVLQAMQACLKTPRMGVGHRPHAEWRPPPLGAWIDLLGHLSRQGTTREAACHLVMAALGQPGWSDADRLPAVLSALSSGAALPGQWATLIHRMPHPTPRLLAQIAQAMSDAGVDGKAAWNELRDRALDLKSADLVELLNELRAIPQGPVPSGQSPTDAPPPQASGLRKLTDTLTRHSDLLTEAAQLSQQAWMHEEQRLLSALVPDKPISVTRMHALCKLLTHRRVRDPDVWVRLLRNVPDNDFSSAVDVLDRASQHLTLSGLHQHPEVAGQIDRLASIIENVAPTLRRDTLLDSLYLMKQTLVPRAYAVCMRLLIQSAKREDLDGLIDLVDGLCERLPAMVTSFWRSYQTLVISHNDIGLMACCLRQGRMLVGTERGLGQHSASRLQLDMLESAIDARLALRRTHLHTEEFVLVMESMDALNRAPALRRLINQFLASKPTGDLTPSQAGDFFVRSFTVIQAVQQPGGKTTLDCVRWWVQAGHFQAVTRKITSRAGLLDRPIAKYLCAKADESPVLASRWATCLAKYLGLKRSGLQAMEVELELIPYVVSLACDLPREVIERSPALQSLGASNLLGMIRTVGTGLTPGPYEPVLRAMLANIATTGRLGLGTIGGVQRHRSMLQARAPHIHWDRVFNPTQHPGTPVHQIQTAGATARIAALHVLDTLYTLTLSMLGWAQAQAALAPQPTHPGARPRRSEPALVRSCLKPLLRLISSRDTHTARKAALDLWGPTGLRGGTPREIRPDRKVVTGLCSAEFDTLCANLEQGLAELPGDTGQTMLEQVRLLRHLARHLRSMGHLPGTGTMDSCASYSVTLRDPDDPASLLHCQTTGGCLQPGDAHFPHMLERLAGWIVWTAVDDSGITCAAAWGTLNREGELVIDFIDAARRGATAQTSELVKTLLDYAPMVKRHLGIMGPVWVGPPNYGRLTDLEVFKRPTTRRAMWSLAPSLARSVPEPQSGRTRPLLDNAVADYTDALNKGEMPYFKL